MKKACTERAGGWLWKNSGCVRKKVAPRWRKRHGILGDIFGTEAEALMMVTVVRVKQGPSVSNIGNHLFFIIFCHDS